MFICGSIYCRLLSTTKRPFRCAQDIGFVLFFQQDMHYTISNSLTSFLGTAQRRLDSGKVIDHSALAIEHVTWDGSSCELVENVSRGEMVHPVSNAKRVKSRFCPNSRRVYALVHNEVPGVPLGCLHVALTSSIPKSLWEIGEVDKENVMQDGKSCNDSFQDIMNTQTFGKDYDPNKATCAIFYSISNLQTSRTVAIGPVGKILILGAVKHLKAAMPNISTFCTLSPIPTFVPWLKTELMKNPQESCILDVIKDPNVFEDINLVFDLLLPFSRKKVLMKAYGKEFNNLVMFYLTQVKKEKSPLCTKDPVANFHLTNGSTLRNFFCPYTKGQFADPVTRRTWENGLGFMANYWYNLDKLSQNSSAYASEGLVAVDPSIHHH